MNKRCSVCNHPSRAEIDRALLTGVPYRPLAARYGLSTAALSRRKAGTARLIFIPADTFFPAAGPLRPGIVFQGQQP